MVNKIISTRKKIASLLDENTNSILGNIINFFILALIVISTITIILESEQHINKAHGDFIRYVDVFAVTIFSIEYLARLWTAPEKDLYKNISPTKARLKYALSPMAIIDLLAILPMLLTFLSVDLRFLRIIRLLRILKLTRYNTTITTLLTVLKKESRAFAAASFVLIIMLIIASSMIYLIEGQEQPEAFGSIPRAMWWALITLTTVGYGDVTPITPLGKVFGGLITIIGIGIVALPAGILASAFSEQLQKNKNKYRDAVKKALLDGIITPEEYHDLRAMQEQFDIEPEEAETILHHQIALSKKRNHNAAVCPHCGNHLGKEETDELSTDHP